MTDLSSHQLDGARPPLRHRRNQFWAHSDPVWHEALILCLGTCFQFFLLCPLTLQDHALASNKSMSLTLQSFLLTQAVLISASLAANFWCQKSASSQIGASSASAPTQDTVAKLDSRHRLTFLPSLFSTLLPLPLQIFFLPVSPSASLLGFVVIFLQFRLLRQPASWRSRGDALTFRRLRAINPRQHGLLPLAALQLAKLTLAGLGVIALYQAGAMLPGATPMMNVAIAFALATLGHSIICESKTLRQIQLISSWQKKYLAKTITADTRQQPPDKQPHLLNTIFQGVYLPTLILSAVFVCSLVSQRFRAYCFLLLFLRQFAAFFFLHSSHPDSAGFWERLIERPGHLLISSFIALIFAGSLILSLPLCSASGHSIGLGNSLFTATSAVCVTGLSVIEPGTDLSVTGQAVLILLIQLGGLGIMTISFFVAMLLSRHVGIRADAAMREMTGEERNQAARRLLRVIVIGTFCLEAIGAAVLGKIYYFDFGYPALASLGHACFLSISSFCNAGFSLHPENLAIFAHHYSAQLTISLLVILGGLSFLVLLGLTRRCSTWRRQPLPLGAHERLILSMTCLLLLAGTVLFLLFDRHHGLQSFSWLSALSNAFFLSASARTAGFSVLDLSAMTSASQLVLMALMFIGAAPGSAAGGVKVTSIGVLVLLLRAWLRGEREVVYARRRVPPATIMQAAAAVTLMLAATATACVILAAAMPRENVMTIAFEVVSAAGTVGLSQGLTTRLPETGKLILVIMMFLGKVGLLTFLMTLKQKKSTKIQYPDARILI